MSRTVATWRTAGVNRPDFGGDPAKPSTDHATVGTGYGPDLDARLVEIGAVRDVTVDGIGAAEVRVPNVGVYGEVMRDSRVLVIDLALEQFVRANPGLTDVVANDVYWPYAGLE